MNKFDPEDLNGVMPAMITSFNKDESINKQLAYHAHHTFNLSTCYYSTVLVYERYHHCCTRYTITGQRYF